MNAPRPLAATADTGYDELSARVGAAALLAMMLEAATRIAANAVGDRDLEQLLARSHGRALEVMVRLRQQLRASRGRAAV